jgi:magnesium-transporting ATPase (P-type)
LAALEGEKMSKGLGVKLIIIFAGLLFAALVLLIAWGFNRMLSKDKKSLSGRIWEIERFLLISIMMAFSVYAILQIINYFVSLLTGEPLIEIPSANDAIWPTIISNIISMLALIGTAASIVWLKNKQKTD